MSYIKLIFLFVFVLFLSCTNNSADQDKTYIDTTITTEVTTPQINNESLEFQMLIWYTDFDTSKRDFVLRQNRKINADSLLPEKLIRDLNTVWQDISLVFKKISNDTIYVSIPNSFYLTQSIGTTGASNYIASSTYNLTELKGIKYVNFDFKEGDHSVPGTYTRDDFKNYR